MSAIVIGKHLPHEEICVGGQREVGGADLEVARRFFEAVAPGEVLTFQTLDDSASKRRGLVKVLHGRFDEVALHLQHLNAKGAGIYWMVNRGDGGGRRAPNVVGVRALFLDLDGAPLEPVLAGGLEPHMVVESSPGKWHVYWLVSDCELAWFTPTQKALAAKFGGDPVVHDLPRVLRVPGYQHRKGVPFVCRLHTLRAGPPYVIRDLTQRLNIAPVRKRPGPTEEVQKSTQVIFSLRPSSSVGAAFDIPAACIPAVGGQRNAKLFKLAQHLKASRPDASREERREVAARWLELAGPFIRTEDPSVTFADFDRAWTAVKIPHGAVMQSILQTLDETPQPAGVERLGYGPAGNKLVRICFALHAHQQAEHGGEPFFLGAREAGALIGVHFTDAAAMFKSLTSDQVLELVTQGAGAKASRYRYIWAG